MRHTKGDWINETQLVSNGLENTVDRILSTNGRVIGKVFATHTAEGKSNVELIKSSPEILRVCDLMVSLIEWKIPDYSKHIDLYEINHLIKKAKNG